jgi:peptidoglycan/xylan/chitin deacetylase (PgdA/CDA1 family)
MLVTYAATSTAHLAGNGISRAYMWEPSVALIEEQMPYSARQYTARTVSHLRRAGARINRRTRGTLVPMLILVIIAAPVWSAASRFNSVAHIQRDSVRVPILVYHSVAAPHPGQTPGQRQLDVDTTAFREQMTYLAVNKFNVISLGTLTEALAGRGNVPARSVVITFDDGWLDQYTNALPILRANHYTATFFVISRQVGRGPKYMSLDEVKTLQREGMTIASHSRTHANLINASDAQLRDEIVGSREDLQKMLGVAPDLFAYPYGSWNRRVAAVVQEAGYRAARGYPGGAWNDATDRYALHSVLATDDMSAFARELGVQVIAAR